MVRQEVVLPPGRALRQDLIGSICRESPPIFSPAARRGKCDRPDIGTGAKRYPAPSIISLNPERDPGGNSEAADMAAPML
jgi:hypothetical protein